jgi:hypothetical protein
MSGRRHVHAILVLAGCMLAPVPAAAQVSPGPLATAHAALDGATDCFRCHAKGAGRSQMDLRCLDCHTEVGWMRARKRGYHAKVADRACASCHPDHGGRDFALVAWDGGSPERFDHAQSGFMLEGRHASLPCRDCHKPALQKSGSAALLRVKDRSRSWLGLEPGCVSCHQDPHRGSLGADCRSCHGQTRWSPAPGFDHARTAFVLTGAHVKSACADCHATPLVNAGTDAKGALRPLWKPVPHQDCVSCHRDPHAGRFKGECAKCHVTSAWKDVNARRFDHDQTRYPLRGAHAAVACDDCHSRARGGTRPRFAACADCHADAHRGTATVQGAAVDCAVCHTVTAFEPSTWPRAQHRRTRYPLAGAHAEAACAGCHTRAREGSAEAAALGPARVRMRPAASPCEACHHDPHAGRFAAGGPRARAEGCPACHAMSAFHPSSYDSRAHQGSAFALEGAHRAVPCQRCHEELREAPGRSTLRGSAGRALRFVERERACAACHADPHRGQFRARADLGACESCHDADAFAPASRFDHARDASFRLEGAHARTPCAACHRPGPPGPDGTRAVTYRPTPARCESCHTSGAPSRPGGGTSGERRSAIPFVTFVTRTGR